MKLTIIIPVYFEENNILKVLGELNKKVKTAHEILVVYDTDKDPTKKIAKDYIKKKNTNHIKLIKNLTGNKRGVANAIKTGFSKAKGESIVVILGDLADDYSQIDKMYKIQQKGFDIVCGSRYMKGGKKIGASFFKDLLSRTAGLSLNKLFKLPTSDPTNSFKMFRSTIFNKIDIESKDGFEYSLEIVTKAYNLGFKITEIPTTWTERIEGKSKFKVFKWMPKYLKWYFWHIGNNFFLRN